MSETTPLDGLDGRDMYAFENLKGLNEALESGGIEKLRGVLQNTKSVGDPVGAALKALDGESATGKAFKDHYGASGEETVAKLRTALTDILRGN